MTTSPVLSVQLSSLNDRTMRLREALNSFGSFFASSQRADPLPTLRNLARDWLRADDLQIIVPAGSGLLSCDDPNRLSGPITIGRRAVGRIEARRSYAFEEDDHALLAALGQLIGAVLEQSSLHSQIDQYSHQVQASRDTLEQLLTFGRLILSGQATPPDLALQLAIQVPIMVDGERASVLLIPAERPNDPVLALSNGTFSTTVRAREVRDNGLAGVVLRTRESLIIDETTTDQRWLALQTYEINSPTRCAMAVPLVWGERLLGALTVTTTRSHVFGGPQLHLLELVACHIALALRAVELEFRLRCLIQGLAEVSEGIRGALAEAHAGDLTALDRIAALNQQLIEERSLLTALIRSGA